MPCQAAIFFGEYLSSAFSILGDGGTDREQDV
jgi:hypothetical protein